jgi:drug/metabolite transporter (DMT)-like permease
MKVATALRDRGVLAALAAALLFGIGTPFAKRLLEGTSPWLLAGLLYLGSGLGLFAYRLITRAPRVSMTRPDKAWLGAAIVAGGVAGPVLLMAGLVNMPASGASLLLNAEGVFTALIAWFVFNENVDRRVALGMFLIVAGAAVLSWPGEARFGAFLPALAVLGACLAWAIDNNLTRKVALTDATFIAMAKGLAAGTFNIGLALAAGAAIPPPATLAGAAVLGLMSYGVSLALFVVALRDLGTARTGAYFSIAPFAGALIALPLLGEEASWQLATAGALMAAGIWLHLTERHGHRHSHAAAEHEHSHVHDEHHRHLHPSGTEEVEPHSHRHTHEPMSHDHPHYPDSHHRHDHA